MKKHTERKRQGGNGGGDSLSVGAVNALVADRKETEKLAQKRAREQAAVAELGQRALEGPELQQLFQEATEVVADVLESEYCKVLELLPDGKRLLLRAGVGWRDGLVGNATVDTGGNSQAGYTLRNREPVVVEDLRTEMRFRGPALLVEHGVVSGLSVTIGGRESPFGVLGTHTRRKRVFSKDDIDFLQAVANILAAAVDRSGIEEALRKSESALRLAIEAGRMGTWEWDVKTNTVSWSETLEALHGLEPGTFGGTFEDFQRDIHPEDRDRVLQTIEGSIETGTHDLEYRIVRPDGLIRWFGAHGRVVHDDKGDPVKMTGVCQDITDRKAMEERLRLKRDALEIASRLSRELDTRQLLQSVISETTRLTGATCGAFYYAAADAEGETLHRYALAGDVEKMPEEFPAGPNTQLLTAVLERKEALRIDDVTHEAPYADAAEAFASAGASIRSILALPVISRTGAVLGAILFAHPEPGFFTDQHEFVVSSLTPEIGVAMDNARMYEAEQAAKLEAEKIARDQSLLSEAGMRLQAAAPDERAMMMAASRLLVPEIVDWCAIDLLTSDGGVDSACVIHEDPVRVTAALEARRKLPPDLDQPYGLGLVVQTGQPAIYPEVTPQLIAEAVKDPDRRRTLEAFSLKSIACVPITSRGRVMGVMSLAMAESDRRFDDETLRFAEELGKRIGLALDNSRLFTELERSIESKDEFLGVVSHELRTPITAIYGGSRLLRARGERLDAEVRSQLLNDIETESERMYRLVENLLALTRVELGQEIHVEPVLVRQVLQQITRAHGEKYTKRDVEVSIDDETMMVDAQSMYFEQIVHNLMTNAEKYSPKGSPIRVRAHHGDGNAVISVSNEAPGMDEEQLNKIFERFYRSEKTAGRASRGIGLGLTVCKRLVEAMGGKITAEHSSEELTISFTLPLCKEVKA